MLENVNIVIFRFRSLNYFAMKLKENTKFQFAIFQLFQMGYNKNKLHTSRVYNFMYKSIINENSLKFQLIIKQIIQFHFLASTGTTTQTSTDSKIETSAEYKRQN